MSAPRLRFLRDEFSELAAAEWISLVTSVRASVRAGCVRPVDVLVYTSAYWRTQLHSPVSDPTERDIARVLLRLLRERRADLHPVAEVILAEAPSRRLHGHR